MLDCTKCGACCASSDENRAEGYVDYVEVDPKSPLWKKPELVRRFVVEGRDGVPHLRLTADHVCAALVGKIGRRVRCSIYAERPRGCRRVEAGSDECLRARRERGVGA